jgi:predicted RNase H-like nuclease
MASVIDVDAFLQELEDLEGEITGKHSDLAFFRNSPQNRDSRALYTFDRAQSTKFQTS